MPFARFTACVVQSYICLHCCPCIRVEHFCLEPLRYCQMLLYFLHLTGLLVMSPLFLNVSLQFRYDVWAHCKDLVRSDSSIGISLRVFHIHVPVGISASNISTMSPCMSYVICHTCFSKLSYLLYICQCHSRSTCCFFPFFPDEILRILFDNL